MGIVIHVDVSDCFIKSWVGVSCRGLHISFCQSLSTVVPVQFLTNLRVDNTSEPGPTVGPTVGPHPSTFSTYPENLRAVRAFRRGRIDDFVVYQHVRVWSNEYEQSQRRTMLLLDTPILCIQAHALMSDLPLEIDCIRRFRDGVLTTSHRNRASHQNANQSFATVLYHSHNKMMGNEPPNTPSQR